MAETTLRIINRYDSKDNWERVNPKLEIGEIVSVEFPDNSVRLKIGIGSLFNNTPYYDDRLEVRVVELETKASRVKTFLSPTRPDDMVEGDLWFDNS